MPASTFIYDLQKEQWLNTHLDKIYKQLGIHFERVTDNDMQNSGVDLIVTKDQQQHLVDEKAQLDYIGKSLNTFAFEIGYFKDGMHKQGWLFDKKKATTHYMLITDILLKENAKLSSPVDIASLKLLWLNRSKLISALEGKGMGQNYCEQAEKDARDKQLSGKIEIGTQGFYFFLSDQKAEAPFNLVITRKQLLKMGTQIYPDTTHLTK